MFEKFKKRLQPQKTTMTQMIKEPEEKKIEDEPKESQIIEESENYPMNESSGQKIKKEPKTELKPDTAYPKQYEHKDFESKFMAIKDYSSFLQLSEMIDKEISQTKNKLGEYLLQIDKKKTLADKSRKIRTAVFKLTEKNQSKKDQDEFEINGLQIVLDATPRHEMEALESVVQSQQDRLQFLQKAKIALKDLGQLGEVKGINFFVVEKYGVPEKILLTVP